jgi:hypothetical protein
LFLLASEEDLRANFLLRDGEEQQGRARVAAVHSERLADRCNALGLPVVGSRPFETLLLRASVALEVPLA